MNIHDLSPFSILVQIRRNGSSSRARARQGLKFLHKLIRIQVLASAALDFPFRFCVPSILKRVVKYAQECSQTKRFRRCNGIFLD